MPKKKPHPLVSAASSYIGLTTRKTNNPFAILTGYTGTFQWDGSFLDATLREAKLETGLPSHANTVTALAFYTRTDRLRRAPKPGDIVFYSFSAPSGTATFDQPHVGVVSDVSNWRTDHSFKAIEAQVSSGHPKASTEENGVYERTRYATDVLAFARLPLRGNAALQRIKLPTSEVEVPTVTPAQLTRCLTLQQASSAKPNIRKAVVQVQLALAAHPGVNFRNADRGVFNKKSQSAFALFQRHIGVPAEQCDGLPTAQQLAILAAETNLQFFRAE